MGAYLPVQQAILNDVFLYRAFYGTCEFEASVLVRSARQM
jgi:hypothetical protein